MAADQQNCHEERILDLNADCVEFCPSAGHEHLLAVGTYQLDEATKTRHGRLLLYSLCSCSKKLCLADLATMQLPGIFDLHWLQLPDTTGGPCIGLALADGTLQIVQPGAAEEHACDNEQQGSDSSSSCPPGIQSTSSSSRQPTSTVPAELHSITSVAAVEAGMALSLDCQQQDQQQPLVAVSSSSGAVSVLQVR